MTSTAAGAQPGPGAAGLVRHDGARPLARGGPAAHSLTGRTAQSHAGFRSRSRAPRSRRSTCSPMGTTSNSRARGPRCLLARSSFQAPGRRIPGKKESTSVSSLPDEVERMEQDRRLHAGQPAEPEGGVEIEASEGGREEVQVEHVAQVDGGAQKRHRGDRDLEQPVLSQPPAVGPYRPEALVEPAEQALRTRFCSAVRPAVRK